MLALLQAVNEKNEVIAVKEIEFDTHLQRVSQMKELSAKKGTSYVSATWATGEEYYNTFDGSIYQKIQ